MKYCKNCHILYSGFAAACPKCGALTEKPEGTEEQPAGKRSACRDWLWLIIGIPVLIAVIYVMARLTACGA